MNSIAAGQAEGPARVMEGLPYGLFERAAWHNENNGPEIAFQFERAIIRQQRNVTKEFLILGALLHEFDNAKLWRFSRDAATEEPHTSVTAWLSNTAALDKTKCMLALQTWRLYCVEYSFVPGDLLDIAPSKFADLNPAVETIRQQTAEKLAAVQQTAGRQIAQWEGDQQLQQAAVMSAALQQADLKQEAREEVTEWVEAAKVLSRASIRSKRKEDTGWIVKTWRVNLREPKTLANLLREIIKLFRDGEVEITAKQAPDW